MSEYPERHHRRSIRLKGYDYTQQGAYFITICTHKRECMLGDIVEDQMMLSSAGQMVEQCWLAIPEHFSQVAPDAFIVMPNHLHGILILGEYEDGRTIGGRYIMPLRIRKSILGGRSRDLFQRSSGRSRRQSAGRQILHLALDGSAIITSTLSALKATYCGYGNTLPTTHYDGKPTRITRR